MTEKETEEQDFEETVQGQGPSGANAVLDDRAEILAVVLSGSSKGTRRPLQPKLTFGKAPDNDVVLNDESVSRRHCEVVRVRRGLVVRDLGSTNGTFVDTARITEATVPLGTLIRVGNVEVAFRPDLALLDIEPYPHDKFGEAVAESVVMRRIFSVLEGIAKTDATVLLLGETGTGKEVLAQSIASQSRRASAPFFTVDCGAVTYSLIESELFGHERGAFTGAVNARKGAFETAEGGTLFLDEVGELPLDVQPKLLRVLEAREFRRVGGNQVLAANVRVIAATKRDLEREVSAGKFREDLYFRLAVVPIHIPPLRARREDIPLLVRHILNRLPQESQLPPSERTMAWLQSHDWPGNVRELRNMLERASYMSAATMQTELMLPSMPTAAVSASGSGAGAGAAASDEAFSFFTTETFKDARARFDAEFERRYVRWLLGQFKGNLSAAARAVKVDRKHLHFLAKKHGIRGGDDE